MEKDIGQDLERRQEEHVSSDDGEEREIANSGCADQSTRSTVTPQEEENTIESPRYPKRIRKATQFYGERAPGP